MIVLGANAHLTVPGQGSVNAELWQRIVHASDAYYQATGIRTQVNSVMRSTAAQKVHWDAYQRYLNGGPWAPTAARPGYSNHERGLAVDAQPQGRGADGAWQSPFKAAGLHFPVRGEPWHIELSPSRRPLPTPVPQPAPNPPAEEVDVIPDVQMTELKQHIEHVVLKVLPRDVLAGLIAEDQRNELVLAVNTVKALEARLAAIEKKLG